MSERRATYTTGTNQEPTLSTTSAIDPAVLRAAIAEFMRDAFVKERHGLLLRLATIEAFLDIKPTTSQIRKDIKSGRLAYTDTE